MADYSLSDTEIVIRKADGANIPDDPANGDRIEYSAWLAAGGVPDPYVPPRPPVPESCSKLGLKLALDELGLWQQVKAAIAADADAQEDWDLCTEVRRSYPVVQRMIGAVQFTSEQVDNLLIRANALV
jgi:hypothetical protein